MKYFYTRFIWRWGLYPYGLIFVLEQYHSKKPCDKTSRKTNLYETLIKIYSHSIAARDVPLTVVRTIVYMTLLNFSVFPNMGKLTSGSCMMILVCHPKKLPYKGLARLNKKLPQTKQQQKMTKLQTNGCIQLLFFPSIEIWN